MTTKNVKCFICKKNPIGPFSITPILDLGNGKYEQCCEKCADKEFPDWRDDDNQPELD